MPCHACCDADAHVSGALLALLPEPPAEGPSLACVAPGTASSALTRSPGYSTAGWSPGGALVDAGGRLYLLCCICVSLGGEAIGSFTAGCE